MTHDDAEEFVATQPPRSDAGEVAAPPPETDPAPTPAPAKILNDHPQYQPSIEQRQREWALQEKRIRQDRLREITRENPFLVEILKEAEANAATVVNQRDLIQRLEASSDKLVTEAAELGHALNEAKHNISVLSAQAEELVENLKASEARKAELEQKLKASEARNAELEEDLAQIRAARSKK